MSKINNYISEPQAFSSVIVKLFISYSFFIAFPVIKIGQNISFYIFFFIILYVKKAGFKLIGKIERISKYAILFSLGGIISTVSAYFIGGKENFINSLVVLPNYFYWSFLIMFLIHHANRLNLYKIYRSITIGIILSIPYYFLIQSNELINIFKILNGFTQNGYAFMLICFSPIVVYFFKKKYGTLISIIIFLVLVIFSLLNGSRAGSILVFIGSFFTLFLSSGINNKKLIFIGISTIMLFFSLDIEFVENWILKLNPRTHELLYNTSETFTSDQSYLVRRAMVDKGIDLFLKHPFTGVGINNFGNMTGTIKGNFEGAELIAYKKLEEGRSAHNSYINILSEGGVFLILPFILILLSLIMFFFRNFKKIPDYYIPVYIGILMMSVHLYFISAIQNVFGWFLIGLGAALMYRKNDHLMKDRINRNA